MNVPAGDNKMIKHCPLRDKPCVESECMLWVAADETAPGCAFTAIALFLKALDLQPTVQINNEQNINN